MYSSKSPKLSQYTRKTIYKLYSQKAVKTNSKGKIVGYKKAYTQKEYLLTLVDDSTRLAYFAILQGKNQQQVNLV